MKSLLIIFISCWLFSACESTKNNNSANTYDINKLEGTWVLEYILSQKASFEGLYPANKPFIKFDVANKRISGRTSCNSFSGQLVSHDSIIDFTGPIAMTKMFCGGEGEAVFTDALSRITSYRIQDSTLYFNTGQVMSMRFVKKDPK